MDSGIYSILNIENGKIYVGQSKHIPTRKSEHFSLLKRNKHPNNYLQSSFNKYGINSFEFNVLEYCELESLNDNEIWWIEYFDSTNHDKGYNLRDGGDADFTVSDETKQKLRELNLHRQKENHDCWGSSVIEDYGGLWFLETMASTGITKHELAKYIGLTDGAIHSYLSLRGTSWNKLSPNQYIPKNSRRNILIDLGGLEFLKTCKSNNMRLVDIVEEYDLGSRSVIHKFLDTYGLKWSELN